MNGVSRFLSRRDKHHEKRAAKNAQHKVCLNSLTSVDSASPLLFSFSPSDTVSRVSEARHRRQSPSLDALYHKLPPALRAPVEDSLVFLRKHTQCRAFLTAITIQISTKNPSNYFVLQSRPSQVSSDLYTIFTNEDSQTAVDKDVEKKVRGYKL